MLEARKWRKEYKSMVAHGISPAQKKQQDKLEQKERTTVEPFSQRWLKDIVEKSNQHPRNIIRILKKDIIPFIGKQEITVPLLQQALELCLKCLRR